MGKRQNNLIKKEIFKETKKELNNNQAKEKLVKKEDYSDKYTAFFMGNDSKKYVLYDKFPSLDDILDYYFEKSFLAEHPIGAYGRFDIKELLEVIKYLYCFYYQQDYYILTFGYLERNLFQVQEGIFEELKPRISFIVGNDKTLEEYRQYQNLFLGDELRFDFSNKKESMIVLSPIEGTIRDTLGICCKDVDGKNNTSGVSYFDYLADEYKNVMYLDSISLFDDNFYQKVRNYSGIEDTLFVNIHSRDQFIAKALISIAIYKKNHEKVKLSDRDYQIIFYQLFQDNSVNISKSIEKDVPKTLKYIPRS